VDVIVPTIKYWDEWRDSLAAGKAQNAGVVVLRRGFATQHDAKIAAKSSSV
jgi:hypothetical protein